MTRKERFDAVIDYFKVARPEAETELVFGNAYELLVAVILSAQCTDKRVNMTTPGLFCPIPYRLFACKGGIRRSFCHY